MATITGLTAARMLVIEAASVVGGEIVGDDLILIKFDESTINAGSVRGPQGIQGNAGLLSGTIPGEIKMWSGDNIPNGLLYGLWVWADGAAYLIEDHPVAAANISYAWRIFDGVEDPGEDYFRVPDLRGLIPVGLDAMPEGGSRANRITRPDAVGNTSKVGEETHVITIPELPAHDHGMDGALKLVANTQDKVAMLMNGPHTTLDYAVEESVGSGDAHENMQPSVFIPYIVCLDG